MSIDEPLGTDAPATDADTDEAPDRDALEARIELLEAETERLRTQYAQAKRTRYRRTALGLAGLGGVALLGGLLFTAARDVLFIIAAIGLFGGLLTYYLTPERFVAADVAERVYQSLAGNEAALAADLGLSGDIAYLPTPAAEQPATLFIPQEPDAPLPEPAAMEGPLVVTDATQGLALDPSGAGLFTDFEATLTGGLGETPGQIARQVKDGVVEAFELAEDTELEVDGTDGRVTLACGESAYPAAFDTPVASLLATALAVGLDTAVEVTTRTDEATDLTVTCQWTPEPTAEGEPTGTAADDATSPGTATSQQDGG